MKPRLMLADVDVLVMDALRKLLESECEIVGTVADGQRLIAMALDLHPDLIILELGIPLLNGMDAGRKLKKLLPTTQLLILTVNEDAALARKALREWASGFLLKKCTGAELVDAIRKLMAGDTYQDTRVLHQLEREGVPEPEARCEEVLTQRQREVLQLLAEGFTTKEAADILCVTSRTIAFHKYRIMHCFNLRSNRDLLKLAIREQLVHLR